MNTQPPDRPGDGADESPADLSEPDKITAHAAAEDDPADDPDEVTGGNLDALEADVPHPVNWRTITAEDAEYEWLALNEWVDWLRHTFGLPTSIIPPYWHRHPELVWELSALHLHWLGAYDPAQHASAPIGWLVDFHVAQVRLREWVALSGTRLDRDRPTRQTIWSGEETEPAAVETTIVNRDEDFVAFVLADVNRRAEAEAEFLRRDDGA